MITGKLFLMFHRYTHPNKRLVFKLQSELGIRNKKIPLYVYLSAFDWRVEKLIDYFKEKITVQRSDFLKDYFSSCP